MTCKDGMHPGINNTTGKCIACGEFINHSPFKKTITKKDLYDELNNRETEYGVNSQDIQELLNEFFSSNICIPKGENIEINILDGKTWVEVPNNQWRIKPSEPVYEWQWYRKVDGKVIDWSEAFRTEQENQDRWSKPDEWYKFEQTKRVRQ